MATHLADDRATTHSALRPPRAFVVLDPKPEEIGARIDWSRWYLTDEEDMGEGGEQGIIIDQLQSSLRVLAAERGWTRVYVGSDQFFGWREDEPLVRVSPDVYLLDDPPERPLPPMWTTWLPEHRPPRFAVEVVSGDGWRKDYDDNPPKYAQLGTRELVVFDPEAPAASEGSKRVLLQVFRRDPDDAFVRVQAGDGPARSEELDAWLVVVREGAAASLRVAHDAAGADVVPTEGEAQEHERVARERAERGRERAERGRERAERERERAEREREEAERKLAEILAELERLRAERDG